MRLEDEESQIPFESATRLSTDRLRARLKMTRRRDDVGITWSQNFQHLVPALVRQSLDQAQLEALRVPGGLGARMEDPHRADRASNSHSMLRTELDPTTRHLLRLKRVGTFPPLPPTRKPTGDLRLRQSPRLRLIRQRTLMMIGLQPHLCLCRRALPVDTQQRNRAMALAVRTLPT